MSYSEKALALLKEISERDRISIFEAASQYCEDNDIEPDEFIESLDKAAIEQIKFAAIEGQHVRKCVHKMPNVLL